jgi:hypothetical protein
MSLLVGLVKELLGYRTSYAKCGRAESEIEACRQTLQRIIGMGLIIDPKFRREGEKMRAQIDEICASLRGSVTPQWWDDLKQAAAAYEAKQRER